MRPSRHRRREPPVEPNMTPMIDVVFLLIIFFLVSSHLARREARWELNLPDASTGQRDLTDAPRLTLNVLEDGSLLFGAVSVTPEGLRERLITESQQRTAPLTVRVRGARSAPYGAVEPVLAACAEAGIVDIGFGVFRAKPQGAPSN